MTKLIPTFYKTYFTFKIMQYKSFNTRINANLHIYIMIRWIKTILEPNISISINKPSLPRETSHEIKDGRLRNIRVENIGIFHCTNTIKWCCFKQYPTPYWRTLIILPHILNRKQLSHCRRRKMTATFVTRHLPSPSVIITIICTHTSSLKHPLTGHPHESRKT
jgi:hypothetical protein